MYTVKLLTAKTIDATIGSLGSINLKLRWIGTVPCCKACRNNQQYLCICLFLSMSYVLTDVSVTNLFLVAKPNCKLKLFHRSAEGRK